MTMPEASLQATAAEWYVLLHPTQRISRSHRASLIFKSLFSNVTVNEHISPDQEFVVLSLLCDEEGQEGSLDRRPVSEACVMPHTRTWFVGTNYSLVFVMDMSASMAAVSGESVLLDDAYRMLEQCLQALVQPLKIPGRSKDIHPCLCITVLACTCDCSKQKGLHVIVQGIHVTSANVDAVIQNVLQKLQQIESCLTVQQGSGLTSQNMLESMLKAGTLGMQLLPRTSIKGIIAFTDGVSGFNSSSSMHSTITEMRTNNISCWIFRAGSTDTASWGYGLVPDCETLSFVAMASNGCVLNIREILEDRNPQKLSKLQSRLLFMSCQRRPAQREGCSGGMLTRMQQEVFHHSAIEGPLESVLGCRIREGFLVSSMREDGSRLEISLCLPLQPDVFVYYTISSEWPPQPLSSHSITISYEAQSSLVYDLSHDVSQATISPYRASAVKRLKQFLHNLRQADRLLGQLLSFTANPAYSKVPSANRDGMPVFFMPPNQKTPVLSVDLSGEKERSPEEQAFHSFWRPVCTLDIQIWKKWMHSHKLNLILSPDTYLPIHVLQPSATTGRFGALSSRFAFTKVMDFLRSWSSFIMVEHHTFVKFLPKTESPSHFCLVRVVQRPPTVVLHIGCLEGIPHHLLLEVIDSLQSGVGKLVQPAVMLSSSGGGKKRLDRSTPYTVTNILKPLQRIMVWYSSVPQWLVGEMPVVGDPPLLHMQYLSSHQGAWLLPRQVSKHDIAGVLLRQRLSEGFNISSCEGGIITMVLQLPLKQEACSKPHHVLLQYVLFLNIEERRDSTVLASEVWMERQHGEVVVMPGRLKDDSQSLHVKDVADKVTREDARLLSAAVTFYQLHECCCSKSKPSHPSAMMSLQPDQFQASVPMTLSSLLPHSQLVSILFTAFSQPSEGVSDTLGVSDVNRHVEQLFYCSVDNMFEIRLPPTPLGHSLTTRLSETVLSNVKECFGDLPQQWHAWVKRENGSLLVLLLPATVWPCNGSRTYLPIIMLLCKPEFLLQPYPNETTTVVLPGDEFLLCVLGSPTSKSGLHLRVEERSLKRLIECIRMTYIKCFLQACYYRLCHTQELAEADIRAALELCDQVSIVIDYGPFFEQVCAHCTSVDGNALQTIPPMGNAICQTWAQDLQEEIAKILAKNHLYQIPLCPEFYLYQLKETRPPSGESYATGLPAEYGAAEPEASEETVREGTDAAPAKDGSGTAGSHASTDDSSLGEGSDLEEDLQMGVLFSDDDTEPSPVDLTALDPPLFVHFTCVVQVENSDRTEAVALSRPIPTCLESILASAGLDDSEHTVRVRILMNCLHPPPLHPRDPVDGHGEQLHEDLDQLPAKQRLALRSLQNQIEWILKDEVLAVCLQHGRPSEELLSRVIAHTSEAPRDGNCFKDQIPISFVFGVNRCQERFIAELEAISIEDYCLEEIGVFFLLTQKVQEVHLDVEGEPCEAIVPKRAAHRRANSYGGATLLPVPPKADLKKSHSMQSSAADLTDNSRSRLSRSFWLVLHVLNQGTHQYVQLYFQRRSCSKWSDEEKAYHSQICSSLKMDIDRANRRVNQWYLLKDMLDTHRCHHLLLAKSRPMEWVDKIPFHGEGPGHEVTSSGTFECERVYLHSFMPYWRLKVSAAKNLARSVLDAFTVTNREDVFVVAETDPQGKKAIFYIRIYESMCEEDSFLPKVGLLEPTVTLDGQETVLSTLDTASSLSVQLGEREEVEQGAADTQSVISRPTMVESLSLALYGICSPSPKLVDSIINVLQKKLDDKAVELLCSLYSRGTVKLMPQDIAFIQPKFRQPKTRLRLPIPELFKDSCQALSVYFLQLLETFTIKPLYSSPEAQHFKGSVDDAIFMYLRPVQQGRGLGLLAVTLCDSTKEIPFCPEVTRPKPSGSWAKEDIDQLLSKNQPSDVAFSIAMWEHGNVAVPELEGKINAVYEDALHTCFLELFLLPSPITIQDPQNLPSLPSSPQSSSNTFESSNTFRQALVSVGDLESSLDFTLKAPELATAVPGFPVRSKHDTVSITEGVAEALLALEGEEGGVATPDASHIHRTWREKELEKRLQKAKIEQQQIAESGTHGQLTPSYSSHIVQVLQKMHSSHSSSVRHWSGRLLTCYDAARFTTSLTTLIPNACWEFCTRVFQYSPTEDTFKQVDSVEESVQEILVVGYCIRQWQEARQPFAEGSHSNLPWMDPNTKRSVQHFHPLDSKKIVTKLEVPFQSIAVEKTVFVPRQRLVVVLTKVKQVDVYSYNLSEDVWSALMADAQRNLEWLQLRLGLLQHILLQKMGLFSHADTSDMEPWTSEAALYCRQYSGLMSLIRNEVPPVKEVPLESGRNIPIAVEEAYLDAVNVPTLPPSGNPVLQHGKQLEAIAIDTFKADQRSKTLDKAFNAWYQGKEDANMPLPSRRLDAVKDLSRLLHLCSTPTLDQSMEDCMFAGEFQEAFMAKYIRFLETQLSFVRIVESGFVRDPQHPNQSQCTMQRALVGGILLTELTSDQNTFTIRMFSLERSRVAAYQRDSRDISGISGMFPEECARLKDATHLHSFSYDFHVRFLHSIFTGKTTAPMGLDAMAFLCNFYEGNQRPSKYIRTRLLHSVVKFLDLDLPAQSQLYQHVLAHSASFGMRTLDVYDGMGEKGNLCLLWPSCAASLNFDFGRDVFLGYDVDAVLVHFEGQLHFFIIIVNQVEVFPSKTVSDLVADYCQPESDAAHALTNLHIRLHQSMEDKLVGFQKHLRREFLWKKLLYGSTPGRTEEVVTSEVLSSHEMDEMLSLVQRVPLVDFDPALKHMLNRKHQWYKSVVSLLEAKHSSDVRSCVDSANSCTYTAVINPLWTDMLILVITNAKVKSQIVDVVYRKPTGVLPGESHSHIEAEQSHIQSFVNFVSSFSWANMVLRSRP